MKSEEEAILAIEEYSDMVRRICFVHLKNYYDVEDVFQEVFLKYVLRVEPFDSKTHEKAWMVRVTVNACKDNLKNFFRKKVTSIETLEIEPTYTNDESREVLEAVLKLPSKYKDVVYLYYYEGYTAVEIAEILERKENTIYTWLSRAKEQLRNVLGGELYGK